MSRYLLDVNVLIALVDPAHVHHEPAWQWFEAEGQAAWATCAVTEGALLRILGNPRYPNSPGSPAATAAVLAGLRAHPGHAFWADDLSLMADPRVDVSRLLVHHQMTDTHLLALAVRHGGRLASFDRRLVTDAVRGGKAALCLI